MIWINKWQTEILNEIKKVNYTIKLIKRQLLVKTSKLTNYENINIIKETENHIK